MSWATMTNSRTPSAASSSGFGHHFFDRLGGVLAAHFGNRAKRTQPVAALGDLQKGEMPRRDPQPRPVRQRPRRSRLKDGPLFVEAADQAVGHLGHLFAAEDADQVVDFGMVSSRASFSRSARQPETITPRVSPCCFRSSISRIVAYDSSRARSMKPQVLTTTKSAPTRLVHQPIAVQLQQAQHPLAVDQVLGAAQADEGVGPFFGARVLSRGSGNLGPGRTIDDGQQTDNSAKD